MDATRTEAALRDFETAALAEQQVLTPEGEVIPNLYAAGNVARFYGSVDYPLTLGGLSLGRASTQGYMCGQALAAK